MSLLGGFIWEVVMYLLVRGDARRLPIADGSVHCVCCSPPYWGLRDYGTAKWEGGEPGCDHAFEPDAGATSQRVGRSYQQDHPHRNCKCGARRVDAQLGLEATPDEFVAAMVAVFREVRRVLHPSGAVWLNMGDSYAAGKQGQDSFGDPSSGLNNGRPGRANKTGEKMPTVQRKPPPGLKPKDLCMIPARLALALQADGWYLRSEITWCKTSPMPESVTDRPTSATEKVYLLAKSPNYYYDQEAVRVPSAKATIERDRYSRITKGKDGAYSVQHDHETPSDPNGRNLWNYWVLGSESFAGAHFATYPRKLVEPCIRAGTSERGCCPRCGAPWVREVEQAPNRHPGSSHDHSADLRQGGTQVHANGKPAGTIMRKRFQAGRTPSTLGWRPSCPHGLDPVPCTVLDPFAGSGTSLVVAEALGRRGIGVELSAEYLAIARRRLEHPHAAVPRPGRVEHHPLFGDAP